MYLIKKMKEINIEKSFFYNKKETINISQKKIWVNDNEFNIIPHEEFTNLILYENLDILKNEIGFYLEFLKTFLKSNKVNLYFFEPSHGGYVILEILTNLINIYSEVSAFNLNVFIICKNQIQRECLEKNLEFYRNNEWINLDENYPISIQLLDRIDLNLENENTNDYVNIYIYNQKILNNSLKISGNFLDFSSINDNENKNHVSVKDNNIYILESFEELEYNKHNFTIYNFKNKQCFIPKIYQEEFLEDFHYFLDNHVVNFKNTIHYTMIVKNAGNILEEVLKRNYDNIDQWTILDTGSTDNTTEIIKKILVGKKKGTLYYEPFKDFKQSRNLCLDFANRTNYCDFCIMLDDTYVLDGNIREFLEIAKKDQFADSFSLYIQSDDTQYVSNRITKLNRNLRYIYKIHEVIQQKNNTNVVVPINRAKIIDLRSDYMEKRTMDRKEFDLKLLFQEYEENPNDPRTLYYIGQTYNLLEKYELAYEYYLKRANHPVEGFLQEKIDSIFEAGRMANFKLNKPWDECLKLYEWAYSLDTSRPDSLYFIGIHHYLENNFKIAYDYFNRAYKLGYPIHCQYSLKPTLSYHYCPKFLGQLCYQMNDFKLGEEVCRFFLENNKPNEDYYDIMRDWYIIYNRLNSRSEKNKNPIKFEKELFIFVADGGFKSWSGSSIEKEGVGGSETWIIETARYIRKDTDYHVIVFCNTPNNSVEFYENVEYRSLRDFFNVCMNYEIKHCVISRFSEYIPVAIHSLIENIYFIIHDLTPSGLVIPIHPKLRKIFCLTEWHKSYFLERFSQFRGITDVCSYGIDLEKFDYLENQKVKHSFIYSSYPNRGLLELLQMWPKIIQKYSNASLNIYSDVNNKWSNENYPEIMQNIREHLDILRKNERMNINYYGWVDKKTLSLGWSKAEYWLYPCVFAETFCLTALEAAASKTFAMCNDLGALVNTVENRGVIHAGDATSAEWQAGILVKLFYYMSEENRVEREILLDRNYEWAKSISWEARTKDLLNRHILINNDNQRLDNVIKDIVKKSLKTNEFHILKIGAYKGNVPNDILYNNILSNTKIIFVEPIIPYFYELKENYNRKYQSNSFIYLNEALGDKNEKIKLYYPSKSNNFSNLPWWIEQLASQNREHFRNHGYDLDLDVMKINTITLNQIISKFNIQTLELLIVDTEGYDFKILMNLDFNLIKPQYIQFENMHLSGYKTRGENYNILIKYLKQNGYEIVCEDEMDTLMKLIY